VGGQIADYGPLETVREEAVKDFVEHLLNEGVSSRSPSVELALAATYSAFGITPTYKARILLRGGWVPTPENQVLKPGLRRVGTKVS